MRYRLRFLLHEFDLVGPEVILGRSPDCQVTIEDPLMSRKHARLRIGDDGVFVSDLGSRNGVRVNGVAITGERKLEKGDRIRLGTQELVFSVLVERDDKMRQTGHLQMCHGCGTAHPEGAPSCPHCGAKPAKADDTMTGIMVGDVGHWSLQMVGEVVDRAVRAGRVEDAERVLRRTAREMEAALQAGERLAASQLSLFCINALRVAGLSKRGEWIHWAIASHQNLGFLPSNAVVDELIRLLGSNIDGCEEAITSFVAWARTHASLSQGQGVIALGRLEQALGENLRVPMSS